MSCLPVLMIFFTPGYGNGSGSCSVNPGGPIVHGLEVRPCFSLLLAEGFVVVA